MRRTGSEVLPLVVFVVALAVRVLFLVATPAPELVGDAGGYDALALRLLDGEGYVDSHGEATSRRPPGYPMFLAAIYWTVGRDLTTVGLVQAVLDATTCLIVYVVARRMFSIRLALTAVGFSIFSLGLIAATRVVLSESLATFLVVLAVLLLHTGLARPSRGALGGAGIVLGLGVLTKGTFVLLPFLLGWVIYRASRGDIRLALGRWAIMVLFFGLTLFPWVVRNYYVHHRFVPVATQMGQVLYSSYNPPQGKIFGVYTNDATTNRIRSTLPEAEQSKAFIYETFRYIQEHPGVIPKLTLLKIVYFISPIDWELVPGAGIVNFTFAFGAPFAAYGLWLTRRNGWQIGLLTTTLVGFFLMAMLTYASPRLRLPVEPLMAIFSGIGLMESILRFQKHLVLVLSGIGAYLAATFSAYMFSDQVRSVARFLLRTTGLW